MIMRRTSAYRLRDRYFVYPESKTTAGVWLATGPFASAPLDAAPKALGELISAALGMSRAGIPHPSSWVGLAQPRLEAAGKKSEADFIRGAQLVCVAAEPPELTLHATHNGGGKGASKGFHDILTSDRTLPVDVPSEALGAAFLQTLAACTVGE